MLVPFTVLISKHITLSILLYVMREVNEHKKRRVQKSRNEHLNPAVAFCVKKCLLTGNSPMSLLDHGLDTSQFEDCISNSITQ